MSPVPTIPGVENRAPTPRWLPATEGAGLAALGVAVGALLDRSDPFLLGRAFPWLALAPLLAGLRHGSGVGIACAGFLGAAVGLAWHRGLALPPTVVESVFAWVALGLLAGEFADAWQRRQQKLESGAHDLRRRLEGLSHAHHALLASHERLRRQVPGDPRTFHDGLEALSGRLAGRGTEGLSAMAGEILAFFADYTSVHGASLHAVGPDGRPGAPLAMLGAGGGRSDDALLIAAVERGEVTSVRELGEGSDLLAAVPLIDGDHRVHAVVAVRDMPFMALDDTTLTLFAVVGGCLGSAGSATPRTPAIPEERPSRGILPSLELQETSTSSAGSAARLADGPRQESA